MDGTKIKKAFLYSVIASVVVCALFGVIVIARGKYGEVEIRILLTTVTIGLASLCGLSCGVFMEASGAKLRPGLGIVLTVLAAGGIILGIWGEFSDDDYWKTTSVIAIFAAATAHICLLSIARLTKTYSWSIPVAYQIIYGLAILLAVLILGEIDDSEALFRFIGVVAVLDAAITLLVPIFHRLSAPEMAGKWRSAESIDAEIRKLQKRIDQLQRLKAETNSSNEGPD